MEHEKIKGLSAGAFRRLTGVKPKVFRDMAEVLQDAEDKRRLRGGYKERRLCVEDQLLMMLDARRFKEPCMGGNTGRIFTSGRAGG